MIRSSLPASVIIGLTVLGPVPLTGQWTIVKGSPALDSAARRLQADFAVPDAPSSTLLQVDPSLIVRPTSTRELGLAVSSFLGGQQGVTLPRAFAAEFSPMLLIGGPGLSLTKYQKHPWLYRLRVSGATVRAPGASRPTAFAAGFRVTLVDEADLRTNPEYVKSATDVSGQLTDLLVQARLRAGPPPAPIVLLPAEQTTVDHLNQTLKERWANAKWNSEVLEIAFAASARARDSLGIGVRSAAYAAWLTYAWGFGSWGQVLIGSRAAAERDSVSGVFMGRGSLSSRFYVGTNAYKLYVQGQGSWFGRTPAAWLAMGGGEALIHHGIWLTFAAGLLHQGTMSGTTLVTNLAAKLGSTD